MERNDYESLLHKLNTKKSFRNKEGLIPAFSKVGYSPSTLHRSIKIYATHLKIGDNFE
ncbi:hypothetical protein HWN40_01415 [Methanolobus zinderi]|uniref:Uncharacterized protein n=1 Tax=Methanolobus zinderi TaxID=536044 RepID=A0A7D5EF30_9EURY|nr:hypothetical protein [Methanolobus zinderi]QLC49020.1 hypothetical protein HWN40_01415 [Methanolobus zinderi]